MRVVDLDRGHSHGDDDFIALIMVLVLMLIAGEGNGVEVEMQVHDLGRGDSQRITPVLVGLSLLSNWQTSIVDTWLLL